MILPKRLISFFPKSFGYPDRSLLRWWSKMPITILGLISPNCFRLRMISTPSKGCFFIVFDRGHSQQNGFFLDDEMDGFLSQPLQFSHIGMLVSLDMGDHLFDRPNRLKKNLFPHLPLIFLPKRKGLVLILLNGFQWIHDDHVDTTAGQGLVEEGCILLGTFLPLHQSIEKMLQHHFVHQASENHFTNQLFFPLG